jgi:two-component sensor histidine kinase
MEIYLKPSVRFVSLARRFVYDVYTDILKDADLAWRLGMATHELLENAVKYASDGGMTLRITTEMVNGRETLVLSVSNVASPANAQILADAFAEMATFEKPADYYDMLVKRASERDEGSGLGLGRICTEASMSLSCQVNDNVVCIKAMTPIA